MLHGPWCGVAMIVCVTLLILGVRDEWRIWTGRRARHLRMEEWARNRKLDAAGDPVVVPPGGWEL